MAKLNKNRIKDLQAQMAAEDIDLPTFDEDDKIQVTAPIMDGQRRITAMTEDPHGEAKPPQDLDAGRDEAPR